MTFWQNHYSLQLHPFLYVYNGTQAQKIAIRPKWNIFCNNVPTTLHLSQIKRISGSQCFLHLFTYSISQLVTSTALSLFQSNLSFFSALRVDIRIIYSSVKGNVKLYWSTQITCKPKAAGKPDLLKKGQIFAGTTPPKLTNTSVIICSYHFRAGCLFS